MSHTEPAYRVAAGASGVRVLATHIIHTHTHTHTHKHTLDDLV